MIRKLKALLAGFVRPPKPEPKKPEPTSLAEWFWKQRPRGKRGKGRRP